MTEKYTKQISPKMASEIIKFEPNLLADTTLDQAFVLVMDRLNLELSLEKTSDSVIGTLYQGDTDFKIKTFKWKPYYAWSYLDFNWNYIYTRVLTYVLKRMNSL